MNIYIYMYIYVYILNNSTGLTFLTRKETKLYIYTYNQFDNPLPFKVMYSTDKKRNYDIDVHDFRW